MASLRASDYQYLFSLGQRLYHTDSANTRKAIATVLMAMSESVIGQQVQWPCIERRFRDLTEYPPREFNQYLPLLPKDTSR